MQMNMTTPTMLSLAIADAVLDAVLAPTFTRKGGELIFAHLVAKFPDLATDAADLVVTRVCVNATAGSKSQKWDVVASDLLAEISPWGDLNAVVPLCNA